MRLLPQRLFFTLLPAALLIAVAASAIWGDNGLLARYQLDAQLERARVDLARFDRENERLLREVRAMESDPVVVERMVADELGWGHEDAILVRFDDKRR